MSQSKRQKLDLPVPILSEDQQKVIDLLELGWNIFFTGEAGTGKSFLLKHIVALHGKSDKTVVTATTGISAIAIGGMTIHRFAGFGVRLGTLTLKEINKAAKRRGFAQTVEQWNRTELLILDEISMLTGAALDNLDNIGRVFRKIRLPFGGIQVCFSGDFFQLPPVEPSRPFGTPADMAFKAQCWPFVFPPQNCVILRKVFRQTDFQFLGVLNSVRSGYVDSISFHMLRERIGADVTNNVGGGDGGNSKILPTIMHSRRKQTDVENQLALNKLDGKLYVYNAIDVVTEDRPMDWWFKSVPAPIKLYLKVGAQVILLTNLSPEDGLANGSRGVVVDFCAEEKHPSITFPKVRFACGVEMIIRPFEWKHEERMPVTRNFEVCASRTQIPLGLAWALTIHKCQGMTLDCARMSLASCWEFGQAYVALSRCRSLDSFSLDSFNASRVRANPDVINFYKTLDIETEGKDEEESQ
jgi:ATP-dependent DNA helicase PIF1